MGRFRCAQCGQVFETQQQLDRHNRQQHQKR